MKVFKDTVKIGYKELGYKELGYNEHPVITNKINTFGWFQSFIGNVFSAITNKTRL